MNAFLGELGKKLAERWVTLLVVPGLLWVATVLVAVRLGHCHALDPRRLDGWVDEFVKSATGSQLTRVVVVAAGILGFAAAAGLAASWLGRIVERLWTIPGRRRPARYLTNFRRERWQTAHEKVEEATRAALSGGAATAHAPDLPATVAACRRISPVPADRPTWIGDRLRGLDIRVFARYRLDMSAAWPRLWFTMPEDARAELSAAHASYTGAARLFGWAALYLVVAAWWWPAVLIAAATATTAWVQARAATATLTDLAEAAVDLHGAELARKLGIACPDRLTSTIGEEVTKLLRKDETLNPPP
ncbi:hypothetical protein OIE68_05350 [Nocardia vinacea]|uniref:hypothetical protein n=1 Tax=Nocardia vinacea TaxID=96468 RepID=UPI002E123D5A|nr:hypothetical protein OIE68_05350 [Nocardia vinacea]